MITQTQSGQMGQRGLGQRQLGKVPWRGRAPEDQGHACASRGGTKAWDEAFQAVAHGAFILSTNAD